MEVNYYELEAEVFRHIVGWSKWLVC